MIANYVIIYADSCEVWSFCWNFQWHRIKFKLIILCFQIITGSHDSTIRLWDLAAGKSMCTLTNHKKSVRSIVTHPTLYTFASASPDNIKQWKCPEGKFIQNLSGHNAIVNCMAVNPEGVLVSGGDNGTMYFWDWRTGYNFQRLQVSLHSNQYVY